MNRTTPKHRARRTATALLAAIAVLMTAIGITSVGASAQANQADSVSLAFSGLEPLGPDAVYEGWLIIDGAPHSTGTFNITPAGDIEDITTYTVANASAATTFVLTIEPAIDPDPAPAATHVLAGNFANGTAALTIDHPAALGTDFADAAGTFIIATPTTASTDDDLSGVWFLDPTTAGGPSPSLDLPTLPDGWHYEGWAVIDGQPISTGTFTDPAGPDDFGGFSGPQPAPPFPGEDFIVNAPAGLRFPTDLTGTTIVISVEPDPDDSPAPFALKPLAGGVPEGVTIGMPNPLGAGPTNITGTATIVAPAAADAVALSFSGLEPLGPDAVYEGWLIIDGAAHSTGTFNITPAGDIQDITTYAVANASAATTFVLTIEPAVDPDPAPAATHVLAGNFANGTAALTIDHPAALGTDFADANGTFIIATPTTASTDDDLSGVWFLDPTTAGGPSPSLNLPTLPDGWHYEGWAVIDGQPVSTGTFTNPAGPDDFGGFSGPQPAPPFPGEDFIVNAPAGLTFPTDLTGATIVISVEPDPDDSPAPFALKPLAGGVPEGVTIGIPNPLGAGPTNITGTATIVSGPTCAGHVVTVNLGLGQLPTAGDDVILGTNGDDAIAAQTGNDVICTLDGDDTVWAQGGNDVVFGGAGNDKIRGGDGDDNLYGGYGADNLAGGRDNDNVHGQAGDDAVVRGGTGDDTVTGGAGDDVIVAGNGGRDTVDGGAGNDTVTGGPRPDVVLGGAGDDIVKGHGGADRIYGNDGNDDLRGGAQPDMLNGGAGVDGCAGGTTGGGAPESDTAVNCETLASLP